MKKVIIIVFLILVVLVGCKKKEETNTSIDKEETQKFSFKGFNFEVPSEIEYSNALADQILFQVPKVWYANVEIIHDKNHSLFNKSDKYYEMLKNDYHMDVDRPEFVVVNGKSLVCYNRHDVLNHVLCNSVYIGNFSYQVELRNASNDFNRDGLEDVVKIMNNSTFRDEDKSTYSYPAIDF